MIDDRFNLTIKLGNKKKEVYFNMLTIRNLYKLTGISVFKWIDELNKAENKEDYITQILLAMFNGYIDTELLNKLVADKEIINSILMIINAELSHEIIKYKENEDEEDSFTEIDLEDNENFEAWYNNLYYCAIVEFNKSLKWFYRATPRQINSLNIMFNNNRKNILLNAYYDINKAKNKAYEKKEDENCIILDEYTSTGDILMHRR